MSQINISTIMQNVQREFKDTHDKGEEWNLYPLDSTPLSRVFERVIEHEVLKGFGVKLNDLDRNQDFMNMGRALEGDFEYTSETRTGSYRVLENVRTLYNTIRSNVKAAFEEAGIEMANSQGYSKGA